MEKVRLQVPELLSQAAEKKKREDAEFLSIKEASERVPELRDKIMNLLDLTLTPPPTERNLLTQEELEQRMKDSAPKIYKSIMPAMQTFLVPVEDEKIAVMLKKGGGFGSPGRYNPRQDIEVNVVMLDSILKLRREEAFIESKTKRYGLQNRVFPDGSVADYGIEPVPDWSRKMNMDDFNEYNALLDRLADPDVIKVNE